MQTIHEYVKKYNLGMKCEWADSNPNMEPSDHMTRHFKCVLTRGKKQMTVYFSQGSAHTEEPTIEDVLDCLAMDASTADQGFEDWCADLGYDTDSIKAEKGYKITVRQTQALKRLLGEHIEELLYETERM